MSESGEDPSAPGAPARRRGDQHCGPGDPRYWVPDVRDGLTRLERVILFELAKLHEERPSRHVLTAMLYGRVVEHVDVDVETFQEVLARLVGRRVP